MANISIHRCTLRIVRHGGWGWGPDPHRILQIAIKALPELIARELAKLWTDEAELEFTVPISLTVPLSLAELQAVPDAGSFIDSAPASSSAKVLSERINLVARKAFVTEQTGFVNRPETEAQTSADYEADLAPCRESGGAILQALRLWHSQGVLHSRLAAFSLTALEAWLDRLTQNGSGLDKREPPDSLDRKSISGKVFEGRAGGRAAYVTSDTSDTPEAIERLVFNTAERPQTTSHDREAILRRRLIIVAEVMIQLDLQQCTPLLLAALDRALPLPGSKESSNLHRAHLKGGGVANRLPVQAAEHLQTEITMTAASIESVVSFESVNQSAGISSGHGSARASQDREERAAPGDARRARAIPLTAVERAANSSGFFATELPSQTAAPGPLVTRIQLGSQELRAEIGSAHLQSNATRQLVRNPSQAKTRQISSALPFLLLGPLSRLGYLKALAATMEAAGELGVLPLLAAALAYKVLAPPARGWRRDPDSIIAATAFATLDQPAAEPALVQLAQDLSHHLSPLDAVLSGALISGHNQQQPLLLLRAGAVAESGFLLLDVEGTFPIQWAAGASDFRQVLIQLDSSIILIPKTSAEPKLLRWLAAEGFHFITDAMPTRGEHWRAIRHPSRQQRWWTNEPIMPDAALMKLARATSAAEEEAQALWHALNVQRPSIPLASNATLDHHLTLAAAVALGTIGWDLWREREPTTPVLALERFSDLPAHVTQTRESVHVCLPLGKRFQDLRDHGLLDDVIDVPWLNGRTVAFSTS